MVAALLRDMFNHCSSQDMEVCRSGLYAVLYFTGVSSASLQEAAASSILSLLNQNMQSPASLWGWYHKRNAVRCLSQACKALSTAQKQECMALLASMLELEPDWQRQLDIISEMQIFCGAVADPWLTYAATAKQLVHMERSDAVHREVRSRLDRLLLTLANRNAV